MEDRKSGSPRFGTGAILGACSILALVVLFFLLREHWGHLAGWWPYLLLLACPLVHLLMHGDHGHGHGHELEHRDK